ncbi:uncharacterized protein LY89DRAFT_755348 [Mollisia scopiformis]|uniref:Uncharacterized protein n=1 Tax=Mollisia scopiformis TaxID=149040 RepID=A0A194XT15_MOLSC|nr:uncharacterized protein LY89DRAFT_755348 [Mollisia scopiformis]KUJ23445.1 hypothetical protein LY89DRAFT_755348 [Mollisia scopiformis]
MTLFSVWATWVVLLSLALVMAAPSSVFASGHALFGNFQLGASRGTCTNGPAQAPALFYTPKTENNVAQPLDVVSLSSPIAEIAATALNPQSCMYCRGKRYDYTAYFHNTNIFSEPPHELLKLVEESYLQKNRLQSLLINYALREIPQDSMEQARKGMEAWETEVNNLTMTIGSNEALEQLRSWSSDMMRQLWQHVLGVQKMKMPPGRTKELTSQFRKLWEVVWIRCVSMKCSILQEETATN